MKDLKQIPTDELLNELQKRNRLWIQYYFPEHLTKSLYDNPEYQKRNEEDSLEHLKSITKFRAEFLLVREEIQEEAEEFYKEFYDR